MEPLGEHRVSTANCQVSSVRCQCLSGLKIKMKTVKVISVATVWALDAERTVSRFPGGTGVKLRGWLLSPRGLSCWQCLGLAVLCAVCWGRCCVTIKAGAARPGVQQGVGVWFGRVVVTCFGEAGPLSLAVTPHHARTDTPVGHQAGQYNTQSRHGNVVGACRCGGVMTGGQLTP
ncbi:hypothetical protein E2C01_085638 [Portunus trituberculatus]|uniref:Uncharacterized protein n=1 Tax=Portunus trituberculatus TaxID=210409 RepID=A0A5B7IYN0_PORTR|nr:hypothetical protein [Portunus trituberculatus]